MKMISSGLIIVYALIMGILPIFSLHTASFPWWLIGINLLGAISLLFAFYKPLFCYLGLFILLLAALLNGFFLYGSPHLGHFAIRMIFSLVLLVIYQASLKQVGK